MSRQAEEHLTTPPLLRASSSSSGSSWSSSDEQQEKEEETQETSVASHSNCFRWDSEPIITKNISQNSQAIHQTGRWRLHVLRSFSPPPCPAAERIAVKFVLRLFVFPFAVRPQLEISEVFRVNASSKHSDASSWLHWSARK